MSIFDQVRGAQAQTAASLVESTAVRGARLLQENSWEGRFSNLTKMLESGSNKSKYIAGVTAQVMANVKSIHEATKAQLGEATINASLGSMAMLTPRIVDVVGIFYPNMISHYIADIHAIDRSTGEIFVIRPKYTNTAAGVTAGDEVFKDVTDGTYASTEAKATLGTGDGSTKTFTGTLGKIGAGSVAITAGTVTAKDDGEGALTGDGVTSGTVNYDTGAVSVTFTAAPATDTPVEAGATSDYENDGSLIREIEFELKAVPVTARPHPLKYRVSVQSSLVAQSHLDINVNDVLTQEAAGLIKQERDITTVNNIVRAATATSILNFDATMTNVYYAKREKYGEIRIKVDQAASLINQTAGRGGVSFVIAGVNATNLFRCVPGFETAPEAAAPIGPFKAGTIKDGTVPVISVGNSSVLGDNDYVIGFAGYQLGDSAVVIAEWVPCYFSAIFEAPELYNARGLLSMYDTFVNRADYLLKGTVSNYNA